jgi:FkbM family methyltransferase
MQLPPRNEELLKLLEERERRNSRERNFYIAEPVKVKAYTFWGDTITVMLPETVSGQIVADSYFEKHETVTLLNLLRPGMTFFDVGAHVGYFSLLASHLVGESGQVHSFEPTPRTFRLLAENAKRHANITVNNLAVYSHSDEMVFNDFGAMGFAFNSFFPARVPGGRAVPEVKHRIQTISIDEYVKKTDVQPDVIKIDAESAEYQIIEGMKNTLKSWRPFFMIEVGDLDLPGVRPCAEIIDFACRQGYEPLMYSDGELKPHTVQKWYPGWGTVFFKPFDAMADQEAVA